MDNTTLIIVVVAVLAVLAAAYVFVQKRRSTELRSKFGPEYERAVIETGAKGKAEAELAERAKRVKKFDIRPLPAGQADTFIRNWKATQARFVDDPKGAIQEADDLLGELMSARGYPVTDFEQRAADLSVDHGELVHNYRIAHQVAVRHSRGEAGTEDLRQAMIHYRALFEDLIDEPVDDEPSRATRARANGRADHIEERRAH
jgi:hypothetical protein